MPGGFRVSDYEPEADPEYGMAERRYLSREPMDLAPLMPAMAPEAPPPLPEMDGTPPEPMRSRFHPAEMLKDWMATPWSPPPSQTGSQQLPTLPGDITSEPIVTPEMYSRRILADQQARAQQEDFNRMRPVGKPTPQSPPSTRGPMVVGKASDASPRKGGVGTQRAIYFARAMGISPPGEPDSPEEMAFVKAANAAMAKLSRGMSATRVFSLMSDPKTAERFKQLLDAEMAKGAKPSPKPSAPATGASR